MDTVCSHIVHIVVSRCIDTPHCTYDRFPFIVLTIDNFRVSSSGTSLFGNNFHAMGTNSHPCRVDCDTPSAYYSQYSYTITIDQSSHLITSSCGLSNV